ncbi:hypothetical protein [Serratia sp. NA_13]
MDQKFFRIPFASAGDKQQIPDEKSTEGFVSFSRVGERIIKKT